MQQLLSIRGVSCESLDIIVDCFRNIRFPDKQSFPLLIINNITKYNCKVKSSKIVSSPILLITIMVMRPNFSLICEK